MDDELALFISGIILAATGCVLCAGILVFNIKYMNLRFIKMTSPRVNLLLVLGGLALYSCCLLLALPTQTWPLPQQALILQAMFSVTMISVTVCFSSMLMKGWRVYRLFQYPRVHTVTIRDCSLFAGILVLAIPDIILVICWLVVDPIKCTDGFPDGNTELEIEVVCTSQHVSAWLLAAILYKYLLMFLCCYIGWQIKQITFSALDDGKCLLLGPGVTLTMSGLVSVVILLFPNNAIALRALTSVSIWIGTSTILVSIFFSKMMTVLKSSTDEPLMSSASRYVKQPSTDDVGTELVKILGENKYLKQKLEESSTLVNHLKRRVSHTIPTDYDSQQTSSANCSVGTSTTSTTLVSGQQSWCGSNLCYSIFCCCTDTSDQSIKGKQGTPVADRDMSIKTAQVQTTPDIVHQECYSYAYDVNQCKSVDDYTTAHAVNPVVLTSATTQDCDRAVIVEPQTVDCESMEAIDFDDVIISRGGHVSNAAMQEDMDLICSIADAYDMGGDSDTFSFISNCLYNTGKNKAHQGSTLSLQKPRKRFSRASFSQSSMLGSDQLYPDSMSSTKLKPKGHRKHNRRQSVAVTESSANVSTVYTNEKGKPIIL